MNIKIKPCVTKKRRKKEINFPKLWNQMWNLNIFAGHCTQKISVQVQGFFWGLVESGLDIDVNEKWFSNFLFCFSNLTLIQYSKASLQQFGKLNFLRQEFFLDFSKFLDFF